MKKDLFWKPGSSSAESIAQKIGLSKGILAMKFMQRKAAEQKDQDAVKNSVKVLNNMAWGDELVNSTAVKANVSDRSENPSLWNVQFYDPYALLPGRRSFGGCNKAIEAHYSKVFDDERQDRRSSQYFHSSDSEDDEMLRRYDKMTSLPRGPNRGLKSGNKIAQVEKMSTTQSSRSSKIMKPIIANSHSNSNSNASPLKRKAQNLNSKKAKRKRAKS